MQDPFSTNGATATGAVNLAAFDGYDAAFAHCLELLEARDTIALEHPSHSIAQSARTTFYRLQHRYGIKLSWRILNDTASVLTLVERNRTAKPSSRADDYSLIVLHYNQPILVAIATLIAQEAIEDCLIVGMQLEDIEPFSESLRAFDLNIQHVADGLKLSANQ